MQELLIDVARADNFWETTFPAVKRKRLAAHQNRDLQGRVDIDKKFIELMNIGYERRFLNEHDGSPEEQGRKAFQLSSPATILKDAARMTSDHLELTVSKEDQLKELKRKQLLSRSGLMRLIPQSFHKYIDYLTSLRKDPQPGDLMRNLVVSSVFAIVTMLNMRTRMAALYALVGNIAIMSILLARNMPKVNVPMGMDRNKVVNWSKSAFKTAVGVTAIFSLASGLSVAGLLYFLPTLTLPAKMRTALAISVMCTGYCTSFYEVFEERGKNGWRWKRAIEGFLPEDVQARLKEQVFGSANTPMFEDYDYAYDPQIDDYPPLPKYLDEVNPAENSDIGAGGSGELDEDESQAHFQRWMNDRRDARKAPILDAKPEDKWVGSKAGMFAENVPNWLNNAYKKNVLEANKWRGKPSKFIKDTTEFEPIRGPPGFRNKRPEWMDMFGLGIWEEKLTASRAAARAFGTYRKTMWKLDKKIQLRPCDGADKEP